MSYSNLLRRCVSRRVADVAYISDRTQGRDVRLSTPQRHGTAHSRGHEVAVFALVLVHSQEDLVLSLMEGRLGRLWHNRTTDDAHRRHRVLQRAVCATGDGPENGGPK